MSSFPDSIAKFDAALRRILTTSTAHDREASLVSFTAQYSQGRSVYQMVRSVCADDNLMISCAQRSVRHPLGFDKFVLHATGTYQLRLHIWWPEEAHGTEHIHNHRFSFVSGIVSGRIQVSSYRSIRDGVQYTRFREKRHPNGGMYEYHSYGQVRVGVASLQTLCPGSAYYLDSGELHRVYAVDDGLSATLFIRLSQARKSTDVLVHSDGAVPATGLRANMAAGEAKRRLESFVRTLALVDDCGSYFT